MAPFRLQALEYEKNAKAIVVTDASQKDLMQKAKEMRLKLRSIRTESDKLRADLKADSLNTGRLIQSIYNEIEGLITPLEAHLQTQEDFVKIQEATRLKELQRVRENIFIDTGLKDFVPGAFWASLSTISDDDVKELIETAMLKKEAKEKADKEASDKATRDELERQELLAENERLRKQAAEAQGLLDASNQTPSQPTPSFPSGGMRFGQTNIPEPTLPHFAHIGHGSAHVGHGSIPNPIAVPSVSTQYTDADIPIFVHPAIGEWKTDKEQLLGMAVQLNNVAQLMVVLNSEQAKQIHQETLGLIAKTVNYLTIHANKL